MQWFNVLLALAVLANLALAVAVGSQEDATLQRRKDQHCDNSHIHECTGDENTCGFPGTYISGTCLSPEGCCAVLLFYDQHNMPEYFCRQNTGTEYGELITKPRCQELGRR